MKYALLFLLSILILNASDSKLKNTPKKKNALKLTEIMKISDEEEGFYNRAIASITPDGRIALLDVGNNRVIL